MKPFPPDHPAFTWRFDRRNDRAPLPAADTSRVEYERDQAELAWRTAQAAKSPAEARMWLERAYRFTPSDRNLAFSLAAARLADGDMPAARALFNRLAERHPTRAVLSGLAAASLACGDMPAARTALGRVLAIAVPDETIAALARALAPLEGWCGLTFDGQILGAATGEPAYDLDGATLKHRRGRQLPEQWRRAKALRAQLNGRDLLGSPIDLSAILRTEGFVELTGTGITGWAWHPAAPEIDPVLQLVRDGETRTIIAHDLSISFRGTSPLARPRGFSATLDTSRPVHVRGLDGRDVLGSPVGGPAPAPKRSRRKALAPRDGVAIVVPVYRGLSATLACLQSVLATLGPADRLIVVDDASPEPALSAALHELHQAGRITLLPSCKDDPARNAGFPAAANAGLSEAAGQDVVLLNSDTIVFPGWLETLTAAIHSAPDIGTATPFSNDATIFTYPDPENPSAMPSVEQGARLAAQALQANPGILVEVPTGHGFCLFIRAACLQQTGRLRADLFAQGYGEENDFCERARALGWRHVAVPSVYVAHHGGVSFGTAKDHLLARNGAILDRLHPTYRGRVDAFIAADPLLPARTRLDALRLTQAVDRDAVLLISHAGHGGTTRIVRERAAALRNIGLRPLVLRGADGFSSLSGGTAAQGGLAEGEPAEDSIDTPNLRFHLPEDAPELIRLLQSLRIVRAELHHLLGHGREITDILAGVAVPFDAWVHDYQWLCARIALVTGAGRFCGEPPTAVCDVCVAEWGDAQEVPITPAALRARSADLLAGAARVIAPSQDVVRRIRRHFPSAAVQETPWEADPPRPSCTDRRRDSGGCGGRRHRHGEGLRCAA
jgi:GT2 family glycosyltransferase